MKRFPAVLLCAAATLPAFADELWRQAPMDIFGGLSSQDARNPGGLGWFSEVVDNFEGQEGWTIESLEFWGGYASVTPGNTRGFMIRFYADNGGQVGVLLATEDVATFTRELFYTHPTLGFGGYRYTLDLATPFAVPAPGRYWMSVVAILDRGGGTNEPQWGWVQSTQFNAPDCKQWFFSPGNFSGQGFDVAFALHGTTSANCYPDCDSSTGRGVLDIFDFLCFQNRYSSGTPYACDCDTQTGGGVCDIFDFLCFQNEFAAGCP
jgi:hypothetical protein